MAGGIEGSQLPKTEGIEGLTKQQAFIVETGLARGAKLELSLGCSEIPRMDIMSKSDPFCIVYLRSGADCWDKIGMTETVYDADACDWIKKFYIEKEHICSQMRFEVYDRDSERETLKYHDFIGYNEGKAVLEMLQDSNPMVKNPLTREGAKRNPGLLSLTLDWVEQPIMNYNVTFDVSVKPSLRTKMYFHILRKTQLGGTYVSVLRSKVLDKGDVKFESSTIKLKHLSAGSSSRLLRIELHQFHPPGKSKLLGHIRTCVEDLATLAPQSKLEWNSVDAAFENAEVSVSLKPDVRATKVFEISVLR